VGLDLEYERFLADYQFSRPAGIVELVGDGPVHDPWLDPRSDGQYPDIESWVTAGNEVSDHFINYGYGFGEPFQIFTSRRNEILKANGIEEMTLTIDIWANQDCGLRVETHSPLTSPDPCVIDEVFSERDLEVCVGPFPPIAGHHAVWTGDEVLVFGGTSGALDWEMPPGGFLFDPSSGDIRPVPPAPVGERWNVHDVLWVEGRALVIGQNTYIDESTDYRPSIVAFDPETSEWSELTAFPEGRQVVGEVVSTGDRLIFVGGDQNGPNDQAWMYSIGVDDWHHLGDAPIPAVEEARGVWTGSEAVFVGGYSEDTYLHHAYDPVRDSWRELSDPGVGWIEYHDLYWTGARVVVAPMHVYTEELNVHNSLTLLVYDPATDRWSETTENPAQPPIRATVTWTGSELLMWGGLSGTGHATSEGSAYDPATDTWHLLAAPLTARSEHTGTWTGDRWVIIGGSEHGGSPGGPSLSDGAIYHPANETWEYLGG
jgi:N-acetylneuraminic acid mutarotase